MRRWWPRPTATGAPRTMLGYYLGRLACRVGLHKVSRYAMERPTWVRKLVVTECRRDRCLWGDERWVRR